MQLTHFTRIAISLIALCAMTWVHAFKPARGFECDCGDTPVFTIQEHCHGPHSEACHEHDETTPCHHHDDLPPDDDTHHHTALLDSLLALKADPSVLASLAATTPAISSAIDLPIVPHAERSAPLFVAAHSDGRRWPQILSHVIALRV